MPRKRVLIDGKPRPRGRPKKVQNVPQIPFELPVFDGSAKWWATALGMAAEAAVKHPNDKNLQALLRSLSQGARAVQGLLDNESIIKEQEELRVLVEQILGGRKHNIQPTRIAS